MRGGSAVVPFARLFYGRPSEYLWEDASGEVHKGGTGGHHDAPSLLVGAAGSFECSAAIVAANGTPLRLS